MSARHPTPWTIQLGDNGRRGRFRAEWADILDANGVFVAEGLDESTAKEVVLAVNGVVATEKLQRTLLGWHGERDQLRGIVRRLADIVRHDCDEHAMAVTREAYAALGEEVPE